MEHLDSRLKPFPTTQWSLIGRAASADSVDREQALAEICRLYWPPVYAFIRSRGHQQHDAEDLTQGLFAELLERDDFRKVNHQSGKLRSYLLTAAQNYLASEQRKNHRLKRGGGSPLLSLDLITAEARCMMPEPCDDLTPDRVFERQWAVTVMEQVVLQLAAIYREKNRQALFDALSPFLRTESALPDQAETASRLGMSPQALRVALHRLRQRYAECLRKTVRSTLGPDGQVEEEIQYLMASFS